MHFGKHRTKDLPAELNLQRDLPQPAMTTEDVAKAREAYCVKCKTKRHMLDTYQVLAKNGTPMMKGTCPVCSTGMNKILPREK